MWLDQLPVDVCERIVRNLLIEWDPSVNIYRTVAALSQASDKQKEAAMLAVPAHKSYELSIDYAEESFNELLVPKLQSLSLGRPIVPGDEPLFRAPNLYYVAMQADIDDLNAVAGCSSLRSLNLYVTDGITWEAIVECLRTLRLTRLVLQYPSPSYFEPDNCPCVPFEGSSSGCNARLEAILSALPELQHLVIRCKAHSKDYLEQMTDRLLQLPNITKINVVSYVPSVHKQHIQKMREVIIDNFTFHPFDTALKLGPLLTRLFATKRALNEQDLVQLKKCNNLKVISITLEQGAEAGLADLVRALTNLQSMDVFWPVSEIEDEEGLLIRPSYSAFPGAVQRAVEVGKKLVELKIRNATLDAFELEQILRSLGKRLWSFTLTISYSDLEGLACLQRCLDCILKYNPSLNKLDVDWQGREHIDPYRAKARHKGPIRRLLRSTRLLYVRNNIIRLPYFLVALNGYNHLAFEYTAMLALSDSESDCFEEEGAESHDVVMED